MQEREQGMHIQMSPRRDQRLARSSNQPGETRVWVRARPLPERQPGLRNSLVWPLTRRKEAATGASRVDAAGPGASPELAGLEVGGRDQGPAQGAQTCSPRRGSQLRRAATWSLAS